MVVLSSQAGVSESISASFAEYGQSMYIHAQYLKEKKKGIYTRI